MRFAFKKTGRPYATLLYLVNTQPSNDQVNRK
jgi:hypothetical protein